MSAIIIKHIKSIFNKLGVTLLKNKQYEDILNQRDTLMSLLTQERVNIERRGTAVVIFSMDRPIQLHATLESYFKYFKNPPHIKIIYAVSNAGYEKAYNEVQKLFAENSVTFIKETLFRKTLIDTLEKIEEENLFFLTDDDIITREYDCNELLKFNPMKEIVTLRMAPYFTRSYTMNMNQVAPQSLKESDDHPGMLEWSWDEDDAGNEWRYPMSVETHLFDTKEILAMTKSLNFKAPNTYEGMLCSYFSHVKNRRGLCYKEQFLFNNPCNKVQNEVDNIAGDITPEFLLEKWNEGYKIDIEPFHHIRTNSTHQEFEFSFIKRD